MKFDISKNSIYLIPLIHFIFSILWVVIADDVLFGIAHYTQMSNQDMVTQMQTKGVFYICITTLLLYFLIKKSNQQLHNKQQVFEKLFYENHNPMWIHRIKPFKILLVNKAACLTYGYTEEEFLKLDLNDIRPVKDYNKTEKNFINLDDSSNNVGSEWIHVDKDGNPFYVHIFTQEIIYQNKNCKMITAVNVHHKILAEADLNNIYKALNNSILLSITDLSGTITEVNDRFCQVSQYTSKELIGNSHNLISSANHSKEFWQTMWQTITQGNIWRADVKNKAKDGNFYWLDTVITPIFNTEGQIYKYLSVSYEITERKELEEKLQMQNEKLSEIAWVQSHELRRPVANILGLCNLIEQDPADASEYTTLLLQSICELDVIIHYIVSKSDEI